METVLPYADVFCDESEVIRYTQVRNTSDTDEEAVIEAPEMLWYWPPSWVYSKNKANATTETPAVRQRTDGARRNVHDWQ